MKTESERALEKTERIELPLLLFNSNLDSHRTKLREWIRASDDVFLAVAFLKQSGLRFLFDDFRELLQRGGKLTTVIGTDFWLTEPAALDDLFQLQRKQPSFRLLMFRRSSQATYHPKFYRFIGPDGLRVAAGSANITGGGLVDNVEISGSYCSSPTGQLARSCGRIEKQITNDSRCFEPTYDDLRKYESEYGVFRRARQKAERQAKKEVNEIVPLSGSIFEEYFSRYSASKTETDDRKKRKRNYQEASKLIRFLGRPRDVSEEKFRDSYSRLVGERHEARLWHSGSLFRSKNTVIAQHKLMQEMMREILRNS